MKAFYRIAIMVVVSLLTLTICGGGYGDRAAFSFVGTLVVIFFGLPVIGLVTALHFAERYFGVSALFFIALIGFIPVALVAAFGAGDPVYTKVLILTGWGWSAAWIATSLLFADKTRGPVTKERGSS